MIVASRIVTWRSWLQGAHSRSGGENAERIVDPQSRPVFARIADAKSSRRRPVSRVQQKTGPLDGEPGRLDAPAEQAARGLKLVAISGKLASSRRWTATGGHR